MGGMSQLSRDWYLIVLSMSGLWKGDEREGFWAFTSLLYISGNDSWLTMTTPTGYKPGLSRRLADG